MHMDMRAELSVTCTFSGEPPSQYWNDIMKFRASAALSLGKYLSTLGKVLSNFNMPCVTDTREGHGCVSVLQATQIG